jgi:hypothetical protein
VDEPQQTLDRTSRFLGVGHGVAETVAPENVKPFVIDSTRARVLGRRSGLVPQSGRWHPLSSGDAFRPRWSPPDTPAARSGRCCRSRTGGTSSPGSSTTSACSKT